MFRKTFAALAALLCASSHAIADEGMWILSLLERYNISAMQKLGCKLTPEQIYSVNNSSIKDAVVIFGGGCTGEIVSDQGLIFTNHHCGYGAIQKLSSVEHNYLRDGFWSKSPAEDLPVDGLSVRFLRSFEDVTVRVLDGVKDGMSLKEREKTIHDNIAKIEKEAEAAANAAEGTFSVSVESFFEGNQYFLVSYDVFPDVRLAGTPPESIGKFGHDTDNWQWPRHTGDFSIFRVYAGADNKPAKYSADNKPYKPKHFLPISLKGMKPGDFAMTIGFPGSTDRYAASWTVMQTRDVTNASRIEPRKIKQDIWLEDMQADNSVYIKYASKYARSSNYYKNSIGMNKGINDLDVVGRKEAEEKLFNMWAKLYGTKAQKNALKTLKKDIDKIEPYARATSYIYECLLGGPELFRFAHRVGRVSKDKETAINLVREFYKDYSPSTDRKVTAALFKYYYENIDKDFHPAFFDKAKKDFTAYANEVFDNSLFADSTALINALELGSSEVIKTDVAYLCAGNIMAVYTKVFSSPEVAQLRREIDESKRLYLQGRMQMSPGKAFYSDANFTMRLSYGTVGGYTTKDTTYVYYTDLEGVMAKEDPNNWEFVVDPKLKQLFNAKDYGRYADADGKMHVCFLTNNDITGGNSGSPVISGEGELLGLAFDGNWEAMSGDIIFEPKVQRTICVDIRYVLFIIDKLGGATNLINELDIRI